MSLLVLAALFLCACSGGRGEKKRELSQLSHAVRQVREAPNSAKAAPLAALKKTACSHYCEFKTLCVRAYETHAAGLSTLARARKQVEGDGAALAHEELLKAEEALKDARDLATSCAAEEGQLRRALGL